MMEVEIKWSEPGMVWGRVSHVEKPLANIFPSTARWAESSMVVMGTPDCVIRRLEAPAAAQGELEEAQR